jgi:meso-butanediol dehydrogenase / (S,S)-butanediol dehydrogenase / diacetyl reductase
MVDDLSGRLALVIGARRRRGIGRAAVLALARAGADIVVADLCRRAGAPAPDRWQEVRAVVEAAQGIGRQSLPVDLDVTQLDEIGSALDLAELTFGRRVDILINAAGVDAICPALDLSEDEWKRVMDVNAKGTLFACQAVASRLINAHQPGRIVNIASRAGMTGAALYAAYCASKFAVIGLTESLAIEWAPKGIAVNAVCPGPVATDMLDEAVNKVAIASGSTTPEVRSRWISSLPLQRLATPEEVADVILFLASPKSSYISGESLMITGGRSV